MKKRMPYFCRIRAIRSKSKKTGFWRLMRCSKNSMLRTLSERPNQFVALPIRFLCNVSVKIMLFWQIYLAVFMLRAGMYMCSYFCALARRMMITMKHQLKCLDISDDMYTVDNPPVLCCSCGPYVGLIAFNYRHLSVTDY